MGRWSLGRADCSLYCSALLAELLDWQRNLEAASRSLYRLLGSTFTLKLLYNNHTLPAQQRRQPDNV